MRNPPLALAAGALAASYVAGAFIANATGLGTLSAAAGNGTKLSAPSFIIVLELLAVVLLARGRRGEFLLLPLSGLSIVAAMFDGDVGNASLSSTGQTAWQVLEVGLSFIVFALAAAAVTRRSRRQVAAAGA